MLKNLMLSNKGHWNLKRIIWKRLKFETLKNLVCSNLRALKFETLRFVSFENLERSNFESLEIWKRCQFRTLRNLIRSISGELEIWNSRKFKVLKFGGGRNLKRFLEALKIGNSENFCPEILKIKKFKQFFKVWKKFYKKLFCL